jgi:hypothetical protein
MNEGRDAAKAEAASMVSAEAERIMGIAASVLGKETGDKLIALVSSGATVAQIEAFGQVLGTPAASPEATAADEAGKESASRQKILAGLQANHSKGVKPEVGSDDLTTADVDKQASALAALA